MNFNKLTLIAFLPFLIAGCSNSSKASPNDNAPSPKSEITTIGNFVIPSMPGWEKNSSVELYDMGIDLEYDRDLGEGDSVYFDFGYNPAKKGEKTSTTSVIKKGEHAWLKALSDVNNDKKERTKVKVLISKLTTFQHSPAYFDSVHINYSSDPQIIDTYDEKALFFSDGTGTYDMSVGVDDALKDPHLRQLADQVWQKVLKEIKPIEVRKNIVKLAITKVVSQPKNVAITFKATNLTKQPLRLSNYSLSSSLRNLHLTSQSGKSMFLIWRQNSNPPTLEFEHIIPAGTTQVFEIKVSPGAYFVSQKTHKKLNADAIQKLKGEWKYQLPGDLHFADNAITHVYQEPFLISGDATVQ
jgi:hypothetical protein